MDNTKGLIKGNTYSIEEIEKTGIVYIKQTYTGKFYRDGNILYVFEEIHEKSGYKYFLKAIIED